MSIMNEENYNNINLKNTKKMNLKMITKTN